MKTTMTSKGAICLIVLGITLVGGQSFESFENESGSNCEQCLSVLNMIQNNRVDEISLEQMVVENSLCDSVCINIRDAQTVFAFKAKVAKEVCDKCIGFITKVMAPYKTSRNIDSALKSACASDGECKAFIAQHQKEIRGFFGHGDAHNAKSVCLYLRQC